MHLDKQDGEDCDAYIKRLEKKIKNDGYSGYITNRKHERETKIIEEIMYEYNYFHTITIQNLDIELINGDELIGIYSFLELRQSPSIILSDYNERNKCIEFLNNNFILSEIWKKHLS